MATPKFDPETRTFAVERWGGYVQVYNQISSHEALADVNFFDGVRDLDDLKKMRDVLIAVISELQLRKGARELLDKCAERRDS